MTTDTSKKVKAIVSPRQIILIVLSVALAAIVLVFFPHRSSKEVNLEQQGTVSGPENATAFHIEPAGPDQVSIDPKINFGKGKFISFWIYPPNEDLVIDTIKVRKHNAGDEEIPFAWLRLNSIRSYVKVPFRDNLAVFNAFPVSNPEEGTYELTKNEQEDQKLVIKNASPNFSATLKQDISVQIFGEFGENISPREPENGIYFCVEEVSGYLSASNIPASARLAGPLCFPSMGIL